MAAVASSGTPVKQGQVSEWKPAPHRRKSSAIDDLGLLAGVGGEGGRGGISRHPIDKKWYVLLLDA